MAFSPTYYRDRLDQVNVAIVRIESGNQSYSIEGRSLSRADLNTLYKERERLEPLAQREISKASSGPSTVRFSTSKGIGA